MAKSTIKSLKTLLESTLPRNTQLRIHLIRSEAATCSPIFAHPPNRFPEATKCESHFLSISIDHNDAFLQIFAMEVLVYSTSRLTTLFVSKADSTGYLHLADQPESKRSILRRLAKVFLQYLIRKHRSPERRLLLSLFARSQNQYLFPGSVENPKKHVLSDRGLIKWWCQVFDDILQDYPVQPDNDLSSNASEEREIFGAKAYVRVPGCDIYEMRGFLPPYAKYDNTKSRRWYASEDPLRDITASTGLPERCLIPRFPDDPKARYMDSLDEELPESKDKTASDTQTGQNAGKWSSVKSLEQFWDTMAFRQECSSGRLVGFLWAVFTPSNSNKDGDISQFNDGLRQTVQRNGNSASTSLTNGEGQGRDQSGVSDGICMLNDNPVLATAPHVPPLDSATGHSSEDPSSASSEDANAGSAKVGEPSTKNTEGHIEDSGGDTTLVINEAAYQKAGETLLSLDYATLDLAKRSTKDWIHTTSTLTGEACQWGFDVVGRGELDLTGVNVQDMSDKQSKKRGAEDINGVAASSLPLGMLKKKPKTVPATAPRTE